MCVSTPEAIICSGDGSCEGLQNDSWCLVHNEHLKREAMPWKSAEVTIYKSPLQYKR